MPPETRSAMRIPRSSSGIGVGSRGMSVSLSLPLARRANEVEDLVDRAVDVVVGDHVVVLRRLRHLLLSDAPPRSKVRRRLASALLPSSFELLIRRRDDEDENRVRNQAPHLVGALHIDLQDDVTTLVACVF